MPDLVFILTVSVAVSAGVQGAGSVRHRLGGATVAPPVRLREGCVRPALQQKHRLHLPEPLQVLLRRQGVCVCVCVCVRF